MVAQLFVKSLTGKTILLNVDPSTTVEAVKQMLYESQGIPVSDQRLLVGRKQLEDGLTLADYNIMSDSSVDVMLRLLGGAPIATSVGTITTTTIDITVGNFGTAGVQGDTFVINIIDSTTPANSGTYTVVGWPVAAGATFTFNWSSFSAKPLGGDSFTVRTDNSTRGITGGSSTLQTMPAAACFLPTSRLLTPEGYKCAKDVRTGDMLVTSDGRKVHVQRYVYKLDKAGVDEAPYVIAKDAFKPNYPAEDMLLSPGHAVEVRPGFWQLPKYMSAEKAKQYDVGKPVTYYHFEAPNYLKDNFICSGAIVESYAGHQLYDTAAPVFTFNEKEMGHTRLSVKPSVAHRKAL